MAEKNEMRLEFDSRSCNEGFARVAVAAFLTQLNPTLEEVADVKTALSEAVTNCIVHAYEGKVEKVLIECQVEGNQMELTVKDYGCGIEDVKKPWNRCLPPSPRKSGREWDLHLWRRLWMTWLWNRSLEKALRCG